MITVPLLLLLLLLLCKDLNLQAAPWLSPCPIFPAPGEIIGNNRVLLRGNHRIPLRRGGGCTDENE